MGGGGSQQISQEQLAKGAKILERVKTPSARDLLAKLQRAVYLGDMKPIEAITILSRESEAGNIQIDPALEMQQFEALDDLNRQATEMGLSPADRNALFDVGAEEQVAQKRARSSIERGASERGLTGSGFEQQAQAEALQAPHEPGQASRLDVARADAGKREGAKVAAGELGGRIREQSFGEQADIASAKDIINRFNVDATNLTRLNNVEEARKVALRNAVEQQRISVENTAIANRQEAARSGAEQQSFANKLNKAQSISELYTTAGLSQARQAGQTQPGVGPVAAEAGGQLLAEHGPGAWQAFLNSNRPDYITTPRQNTGAPAPW